MYELDRVDKKILGILRDRPRIAIAQLARLIPVARGTAQARLDRLERTGVIVGYGPEIDAKAVGYGVLAFVTLEIAQVQDDRVVENLKAIPEILEVHAITGPGDLLCRVVARSNDHLDEILQQIATSSGSGRSVTHLALQTRFNRSIIDLAVADST